MYNMYKYVDTNEKYQICTKFKWFCLTCFASIQSSLGLCWILIALNILVNLRSCICWHYLNLAKYDFKWIRAVPQCFLFCHLADPQKCSIFYVCAPLKGSTKFLLRYTVKCLKRSFLEVFIVIYNAVCGHR